MNQNRSLKEAFSIIMENVRNSYSTLLGIATGLAVCAIIYLYLVAIAQQKTIVSLTKVVINHKAYLNVVISYPPIQKYMQAIEEQMKKEAEQKKEQVDTTIPGPKLEEKDIPEVKKP